MNISFLSSFKIKFATVRSLRLLAAIHQRLFSIYLRRDYFKRQNWYEKKLYQQRKHFFHQLQIIRRLSKKNDFVPNKLENLFQITCSLHQLRFRVKDYSIFEMCQEELQGIGDILINLFYKLARKVFFRTIFPEKKLFQDKMNALEQFYERTLQLVSSEPIVFLFFIQDLYKLNEEIY